MFDFALFYKLDDFTRCGQGGVSGKADGYEFRGGVFGKTRRGESRFDNRLEITICDVRDARPAD
jgi:hypothetical protein